MTRQVWVAAVCLVVVLAAAFIGADALRNQPMFSLSPPPPKDAPAGTVTQADIPESKRVELNRTFFTAWAAIVLVTPAFCAFPFRRSRSGAAWWRAFWTAGFIAFAVHFYWSIFVIFDGDWGRINDTTRVSAPVAGTVLIVWWALDVLLAWLVPSRKWWIETERAIVHLAALLLFFGGSAIQGEIWWSRALGYAMAAAVALSCGAWLVQRLRKGTAAPVPAPG